MANGAYNVLHKADKSDIIFEINIGDGGDIPDDQQNLVIEISNVLATTRLIYDNNPIQFSKAFEQLFFLAKVGLEGNNAQPALAGKALVQFKKEIVDRESGKIKNKYLRALGGRSLILGLPILIIGMIINYLFYQKITSLCIQLHYVSNLMILWSGTMAGVWLSFAITRTTLSFDDLGILEKDGLEPTLRLLFTGALSVIYGLLFITSAIEIKLGNLSSQNILTSPVTAFLIGSILGINEKIIGSNLTKKTSGLFST